MADCVVPRRCASSACVSPAFNLLRLTSSDAIIADTSYSDYEIRAVRGTLNQPLTPPLRSGAILVIGMTFALPTLGHLVRGLSLGEPSLGRCLACGANV